MAQLSAAATETLRREVFATGALSTYILIDGAAVAALLDHLYADRPNFACLFTGPLDPDMQEMAPYLVELREGESFTEWVLNHGFGEHWGVFLRGRLALDQARRRFRKLLFARSADGDPLFFRFYDPRVFRGYLPSCVGPERWPWFDEIDCYLVEAEAGDCLLRISAGADEQVLVEERPLTGTNPAP